MGNLRFFLQYNTRLWEMQEIIADVFHWGKKVLDKRTILWFNTSNTETYEAEGLLQAHPQRVPGAESGTKSGAANGPLRAGGNGRIQSIF